MLSTTGASCFVRGIERMANKSNVELWADIRELRGVVEQLEGEKTQLAEENLRLNEQILVLTAELNELRLQSVQNASSQAKHKRELFNTKKQAYQRGYADGKAER